MQLMQTARATMIVAGGLFGLAIGGVLAWTSLLQPLFDLRALPVDLETYGVAANLVAALPVLLLSVIGGIAIGLFRERAWAAFLSAAVATSVMKTFVAYLVTVSSVKGNDRAELILFQLPIGLIFGALLWLLIGAFGGLIARSLFTIAEQRLGMIRRRGPLIFLGALALGSLFGYAAGGTTPQQRDSIAAARAVAIAVEAAAGRPALQVGVLAGYAISDPAAAFLRDSAVRLQLPYRISLGENDGFEVATDVRFASGWRIRCVSRGAHISRCFEQ